MKVVTLITNRKQFGYVNWLKPACRHHKLHLVPLYYKWYPSHKLKDIMLLNYLEEDTRNEIILFTDAYDTTFVADESEILEKFYRFNAPIVFSAEINCFPDLKHKDKYPDSSPNAFFKFLNSGAFIGESHYIREIIEKYYSVRSEIDHVGYSWSNQYVWNQIYLREQNIIRLDTIGEIFYTLSSKIEYCEAFNGPSLVHKEEVFEKDRLRISNEIIFENGRIKSLMTGTSPCHIHFTSPISKSLMSSGFFNSIRR